MHLYEYRTLEEQMALRKEIATELIRVYGHDSATNPIVLTEAMERITAAIIKPRTDAQTARSGAQA